MLEGLHYPAWKSTHRLMQQQITIRWVPRNLIAVSEFVYATSSKNGQVRATYQTSPIHHEIHQLWPHHMLQTAVSWWRLHTPIRSSSWTIVKQHSSENNIVVHSGNCQFWCFRLNSNLAVPRRAITNLSVSRMPEVILQLSRLWLTGYGKYSSPHNDPPWSWYTFHVLSLVLLHTQPSPHIVSIPVQPFASTASKRFVQNSS